MLLLLTSDDTANDDNGNDDDGDDDDDVDDAGEYAEAGLWLVESDVFLGESLSLRPSINRLT